MTDRPLNQLTLREKLTEAERLTRELAEHLDQAFLSKTVEMQKMIRPQPEGQVDETLQDAAIHNAVRRLIASHQYTEQIFGKVHEFCIAIDADMKSVINGG